MLKDVVEVRSIGGYRIHLRFEDGVEGDLDLGSMIEFKGIFATVVWPNGADLDPDVLYSILSGKPIAKPEAMAAPTFHRGRS